jgi:radical SAM superfamily enzyme YgiQ (UPF0313 family)
MPMHDQVLNEDNPVILLYPPQADPTAPYSSLPALTGFLRSRGLKVIQRDLNIELLDQLLTPQLLNEARLAAVSRADNPDLPMREEYLERFYKKTESFPYVIDHVNEAKQVMREGKLFYDFSRYRWALSLLRLACELISLPHHPTVLKLSSYERELYRTFQELKEATSRRTDNVFFDLFKRKVVPDILSMNPLLVGISTTFHFQIVPGFTLSRLIKAAAPDVHVNIGGATVHSIEDRLLSDPGCFEFADSFVVGEGETALELLAKNLLTGKDLMSIPNLVSNAHGRPHSCDLCWHEDVNSLPCPDFDGLELDRYLAPEPVFLISSSRGCYYGKCAFCDVSMNTRQVHRSIETMKLAANIMTLHHKYGAKRFIFCDDAMPPKKMLEVAKLVTASLPGATWGAEARFESALTAEFLSTLKRGGCRWLLFGLESASQRVLNAMHKGTSIERSIYILDACAANGIAVNLQFFLGFPSETKEEAHQTIDFLVQNESKYAEFGSNIFVLDKDTPVFADPRRYGLTRVFAKNEGSLFPQYHYITSHGMSAEETQREYDLAWNKLSPIHRKKHKLNPDCHRFLYFSHYDYAKMSDLLKETDEPRWKDKLFTLVRRVAARRPLPQLK